MLILQRKVKQILIGNSTDFTLFKSKLEHCLVKVQEVQETRATVSLGVSNRLIEKHRQWASDKVKDNYAD